LALATGWTWEYINALPVTLLREWMAFDRYVEPFGREWEQTGTLAALTIAPHVKGRTPKPEDFMPIRRPPMTGAEIAAELGKLKPQNNGQT
jgi:hypothetical protein